VRSTVKRCVGSFFQASFFLVSSSSSCLLSSGFSVIDTDEEVEEDDEEVELLEDARVGNKVEVDVGAEEEFETRVLSEVIVDDAEML
jgi:hypothetical protein